MVLPCKLVLLLEQLFARKIGKRLVLLDPRERIAIYAQALAYAEQDLRLFSYVLGHRRLVTSGTCRRIDEVILACACRDPKNIPRDFRDRLPRGSYVAPMLSRLYASQFELPRFDFEESLEELESFAVAAE